MSGLSSQSNLCACGRATRGAACSGCLDHIHQSACAFLTSTKVAQAVGREGVRRVLPATLISQLCRAVARVRYVVQGQSGRFLPDFAGGASRSAGFFGGPVVSIILVFLSPFVAERKGTLKCLEKVADHRTEVFLEIEA